MPNEETIKNNPGNQNNGSPENAKNSHKDLNPFKDKAGKEANIEDAKEAVENEQKFKEAQTERD